MATYTQSSLVVLLVRHVSPPEDETKSTIIEVKTTIQNKIKKTAAESGPSFTRRYSEPKLRHAQSQPSRRAPESCKLLHFCGTRWSQIELANSPQLALLSSNHALERSNPLILYHKLGIDPQKGLKLVARR